MMDCLFWYATLSASCHIFTTDYLADTEWGRKWKWLASSTEKNTLLIDINNFLATFCRQKVAQKLPQPTLRSERRGQVLLALCRAARRKTKLGRNLRGRHLSSVKRMLRTFEAIKRSPFLNPPTACRPISSNFAVRRGSRTWIFFITTITNYRNYNNYTLVIRVIL